jgi:NAD+ kinase
MTQTVLLVVHPNRVETHQAAEALVASASSELAFLSLQNISGVRKIETLASEPNIDVAVVFGGDGTILRAAELVRGRDIPILGVNLGHVGFLAQVEKPSLKDLANLISSRNYTTESRLLVSFQVERAEKVVATGFALNEVVVESPKPEMVELFVHVDDRPLSYWGCDGVLIATPTGSTAYAFSAGGPVVWPSVDAMVLLPLAAHALFNRPMVVATSSSISVEIESEAAVLAADGFRRIDLYKGDRIRLTAAEDRIKLAHVDNSLFTDRLVAKFKLPVEGWRGA